MADLHGVSVLYHYRCKQCRAQFYIAISRKEPQCPFCRKPVELISTVKIVHFHKEAFETMMSRIIAMFSAVTIHGIGEKKAAEIETISRDAIDFSMNLLVHSVRDRFEGFGKVVNCIVICNED